MHNAHIWVAILKEMEDKTIFNAYFIFDSFINLNDRLFEILSWYDGGVWAQIKTSRALMAIDAPLGSIRNTHTTSLYVSRISNSLSLN